MLYAYRSLSVAGSAGSVPGVPGVSRVVQAVLARAGATLAVEPVETLDLVPGIEDSSLLRFNLLELQRDYRIRTTVIYELADLLLRG